MSASTAVDESSPQRIILRLDEASALKVARALEASDDFELVATAAAISGLIRPTLYVTVYDETTSLWKDPLAVSGQVHAFLKDRAGREVSQRFVLAVMDQCKTTEDVVRLAMTYANVVPMATTANGDQDFSWRFAPPGSGG